jgi:eukaryotic-like serine/threonine-protein kinase
MDPLLQSLIGEYRIQELIGAGGFGSVYRAVHTHLGRVIAVKVLSPELADAAALQRFYGEAAIQASLKHPGVAEYLGFFQHAGRPCILMEFVDGESLAAILKRGPLPPVEAARIVREISAVAAHFHAQGVVHRDLKSNNVKISSTGQVKVLDFGIARHQSAHRLTATGMVVGTPHALAPEQIRGQAVTEAVDIWQLGVLFYEMLTGSMPFGCEANYELYGRIIAGQYPPPSQVRAGVPAGLERIIARCLEKEPARRFRSGAELWHALHDWEQTVEGPRYRSRLPLYAAIASLVVLLLISLGVALYRRTPDTPPPPPPPNQQTADTKTVTIDTNDGAAEVYRDGRRVGVTPYRVNAREGETINLILRREGFKDMPLQFEPTERREYTYTLESLKGH